MKEIIKKDFFLKISNIKKFLSTMFYFKFVIFQIVEKIKIRTFTYTHTYQHLLTKFKIMKVFIIYTIRGRSALSLCARMYTITRTT